jgi:hypothetical protein
MPTFRKTAFTWFTEGLGDGPRESLSPGESRVVAPIDVQDGTADGRAQAGADLLGWNKYVVNPAAGSTPAQAYVSRQTPMPYPGARVPAGSPAPANGRLYAATLLNGLGLGVASPSAAFGVNYSRGYRWQITFRRRLYAIREDAEMVGDESGLLFPFPDEGWMLKNRGLSATRYVERDILPAGRFLTLPTGFVGFPDGDTLLYSLPYNEVFANVVYRWRLVPRAAVPLAAIAQCMGATDHSKFDFAVGGTMILVGARVELLTGPLGDDLADLTYAFLYQPHTNRSGLPMGVNSALRVMPAGRGAFAGSVDYDAIVSRKDLTTPVVRMDSDFASLFRPDNPPP